MAWVTRGHQRYYYRSRRINGRRVTLYLGKGKAVEQFLAREGERKAERQQAAAFDRELDEVTRALRVLTSVLLKADGYTWTHGQWRRKRRRSTSG